MDPYVGEIRMFGGNYAPVGWALCQGQLVSVAQYDALFSLLGTRYGGDGQSTFGLPDLRGRVALHYGAGKGLTNRVLGQKFGEEEDTLSVQELPAHEHQLMANNAPASYSNSPANMVLAKSPSGFQHYTEGMTAAAKLSPAALESSGGGYAHNNIMPCQVLTFIISLTGVFPPRS